MSSRIIAIKNPDIAAAVMLATGERPIVSPDPGKNTMLIEFTDCSLLRKTMLQYASGNLYQNIPQFAACRGLIYRLIRETSRKGGR